MSVRRRARDRGDGDRDRGDGDRGARDRSRSRGRDPPDCRSPRRPDRDPVSADCRESIRYWRGVLRGPWVMFENGTVVINLAAANRNDLANAAIVELTDAAGDTPVHALPVGGGVWACHANDRVWVRVARAACMGHAVDVARGRVDEDRSGLRIIYVRR